MTEPSALTLDDWSVSEWLGAPHPDYAVGDLAGRVVLAAAFQMLCPACVQTTVPQLRLAAATFAPDQVAVVGLHTVFEHHAAMTPLALKVFLSEYRITFPVGVDRPRAEGPLPATMRDWDLQGTPTTLLLDRAGRLRQDPARDQARMLGLQGYWREYLKLRAARGGEDAELADLRWAIEELRVSTFAQELGTAQPVSPKRIARLLEAATRS